jgi:hypothetical protein
MRALRSPSALSFAVRRTIYTPTDMDMEQGLLDCEWSDYAHDKMVFQANIEVDGLEYDTYDFVE